MLSLQSSQKSCLLAALTLPPSVSALPHFTSKCPCLAGCPSSADQLHQTLAPESRGSSGAKEHAVHCYQHAAVNFRPQGPVALGISVLLSLPQGTLEKACALAPGWLCPCNSWGSSTVLILVHFSPHSLDASPMDWDSHWCTHKSCYFGTVCSICTSEDV